MRPFILSALLICFATYISAFPTGAPKCESNPAKMAAVGTMGKQAKLGYKIVANIPKTGYTPGKSVDVAITGQFKGILIFAVDAKGKHVGELDLPLKTLQYKDGCDDPKSTVTHSDPSDKNNVKFKWTPPAKSVGKIMFKATFVKGPKDGFELVQSEPFLAAGDGKTPPPSNNTTAPTGTAAPTGTGTMTMTMSTPGYGAPTGTDSSSPTGTGTDSSSPTGANAQTDTATPSTSPSTTAKSSGGMSISQYSSFGALVIANVAAIAILI